MGRMATDLRLMSVPVLLCLMASVVGAGERVTYSWGAALAQGQCRHFLRSLLMLWTTWPASRAISGSWRARSFGIAIL